MYWLFLSLETWMQIISQHDLQWLKEDLCSTRNPAKSNSALVTFWSKLEVAVLAPQSVNFLFFCKDSTHSLCFGVAACLVMSFSPPCPILKSHLQTKHEAKFCSTTRYLRIIEITIYKQLTP